MRPPIGPVAFGVVSGLAFLSGAGVAQAQNTVTRQITTEPVETVIMQGPAGTEVTRRVLNPAPLGGPVSTFVPPPVNTPPVASTVGEAPVVERAHLRRHVAVTPAARRTTTTRATTTRATTVSAAPRTTGLAVRTVGRRSARLLSDQPLALSPAQRQIIYRTVVQRNVYPAPVVNTPPIVAETEVNVPPPGYSLNTTYPAYDEYNSYDRDYAYRDRYNYNPYTGDRYNPYTGERDYVWHWNGRPVPPAPVVAPVAAAYVVGNRIPVNVPLVAVPGTVAARVPLAGDYSYATIGGRVYLVDPATGVIVADVTE